MHLRRKLLLPTILIFSCAANAQSPDIHECQVLLFKYPTAHALDNEDPEDRQEVGKFEMASPSEGTKRKLAYPVKGTKMNVFVDILYDDNLAYYTEWFHDAINLTMTISEDSKPVMSKSLSVVTTQLQHTDLFRQVELGTLVRKGNSWYDFWVICRLKNAVKQKELEKAIEEEKRATEKEKQDDKKVKHAVKPIMKVD